MGYRKHFINGIDVSHYQGTIDWSEVKKSNERDLRVQFIYFKCTEGAIIKDESTESNAMEAKGLNFPIGYYHFAYPQIKKGDAKSEAEFFIKILKTLPKPTLDFPYVLDLEVNPDNLSKEQFYRWIKKFRKTFKKYSKTPLLIYGSPNFLDSNLPSDHKLGKHPLWVAHYQTPIPRVPKGWLKWHIWQYTDRGNIDGINAKTDLNYKLINYQR